MSENDFLTVAAVSGSAAWLTFHVVRLSLSHRRAQAAADRKAAAK